MDGPVEISNYEFLARLSQCLSAIIYAVRDVHELLSVDFREFFTVHHFGIEHIPINQHEDHVAMVMIRNDT